MRDMRKVKGIYKELYSSLSVMRFALSFVFKAAPAFVILISLLLLLQGFAPAATVLMTKSVVQALVNHSGIDYIFLIKLTLIWSLIIIIMNVSTSIVAALTGDANEIFTSFTHLNIMKRANRIEYLESFEDKKFYDDVQILSQQASARPVNFILTITSIIRDLTTVISLIVVLCIVSSWIPLFILISIVPLAIISSRLQSLSWSSMVDSSHDVRLMRYYMNSVLSLEHIKEIRLLNLETYFENRYEEASSKVREKSRLNRIQQITKPLPVLTFGIIINICLFIFFVSSQVKGVEDVGKILVFVQSMTLLQMRLPILAQSYAMLGSHLPFFQKLKQFLGSTPLRGDSRSDLDFEMQFENIEFRNVSFVYPDGRVALEDVSFQINSGDVVAIVGENGAGKSTVVKLICGLYLPTSGDIFVNGINLRSIDIQAWRARIGAVFQDFGKFNLTIRENIEISTLLSPLNKQEMQIILKESGVSSFVSETMLSENTLIGKQFGGTELSGGQWQKIAIARALARDSELLILDEPTSALDPRSEFELFRDFYNLARGKTTLFVTHRLTSVLNAKYIFVFKDGHLIEKGSHQELMRIRGEYSDLYGMQAQQFEPFLKAGE